MTFTRRILAACTAAALCLGATAFVPAAADTATAHDASKMMRHQPVMAPMHHRGRMMTHHHRRMMRHGSR